MATRFYFPSDKPAPFNPSFTDGLWNYQASVSSPISLMMVTKKTHSAFWGQQGWPPVSGTYTARIGCFVSEPLAPQTLAGGGWLSWTALWQEQIATVDATATFVVRQVSRDGVHKLQLASGIIGPEISTSGNTRGSGTYVGPATIALGDRIVFEFGAYLITPAAGWISFMSGTPDGYADYPDYTAVNAAWLTPWVEFSQDLIFEADIHTAVGNFLAFF